jgi:hypothetical protein
MQLHWTQEAHITGYLWCGLFFNLRRKKNWSDIFTLILHSYLTSSLCAKPLNIIPLELLGMWQVPARTGPFHPHAHSILIFTSPFSQAGVSIDAFTVLPMGTAWLGRSIFQYYRSLLQFQFLGHLLIYVKYRLAITSQFTNTHNITYSTYTVNRVGQTCCRQPHSMAQYCTSV